MDNRAVELVTLSFFDITPGMDVDRSAFTTSHILCLYAMRERYGKVDVLVNCYIITRTKR